MTLEEKIKDRLSEGQEFKNKQELYRVLDLVDDGKVLRGTQMKAVDKEISAILSYEKLKGNKIRISEIYDVPHEITDKRRNGIYLKYIESILLSYLLNENSKSLDLTYQTLFTKLGMNNDYYNDSKYRCIVKEMDNRLSDTETNNFFLRSYIIMKTIINRALESLIDQSLVVVKYYKVILTSDFNDSCHEASNEELVAIANIERHVLNEMGVKSKAELFWRGKATSFYSKVDALLKDKYGWIGYYDRITILPTEKSLLRTALDDHLLEIQTMELNQKVIQAVNKDASNRYERQERHIKEIYDTEIKDSMMIPIGYEEYNKRYKNDNIHYPDYYVEMQEKLANYFLSLNPDDYKELLDHYKKRKNKKILDEVSRF